MKNAILAFAFMLIGSFAFASSHKASDTEKSVAASEFSKLGHETSTKALAYTDSNNFTIEPVQELQSLLQLGNDLCHAFENVQVVFAQCYIKITGTINGQPVNLELRFEAENCYRAYVEILKGLAEK